MLPWYQRPIQPSRYAFLMAPTMALITLAACGTFASLLAEDPPSRFQGVMLVSIGCVLFFRALNGSVRRRHEGGRCPGFSVLGVLLGGLGLMVVAIPQVVWSRISRDEAVPPALIATQRVCWWVAGVLLAAGVYAVFSHRHGQSEQPPS